MKTSQKNRAAAVIRLALAGRNDLDHKELKARLVKRGIAARLFDEGVRVIRDLYGENSLVTRRDDADRRRLLYVLDPEVTESWSYINEQCRRAMTEMTHQEQNLAWLADHYTGVPNIRNARRYVKNAIAEIAELMEATANGIR